MSSFYDALNGAVGKLNARDTRAITGELSCPSFIYPTAERIIFIWQETDGAETFACQCSAKLRYGVAPSRLLQEVYEDQSDIRVTRGTAAAVARKLGHGGYKNISLAALQAAYYGKRGAE